MYVTDVPSQDDDSPAAPRPMQRRRTKKRENTKWPRDAIDSGTVGNVKEATQCTVGSSCHDDIRTRVHATTNVDVHTR